jgi:hypothetical protein
MRRFICNGAWKAFLFSAFLLPVYHSKGQNTVEKVATTTGKINQANTVAGGATNAISNTVNTVQSAKTLVEGFFKKKKKPGGSDNGKPAIEKISKITILAISNIDYKSLKSLEDSIRTVEGVENTKKTFAEGQSTIEVNYKGEADELWDIIAEAMKNIYVLKAIAGQKIELEFKKPS